mgnify:CR=1 FL=1
MESKSIQKDIRMPARKLRRVINVVRGKSVTEARKILKFMPYFAARMVEKNLKYMRMKAQLSKEENRERKVEFTSVSDVLHI